ncbi:hypothetical protein AB4160_13145 [Shewanella sp. 10N.286.51.B8]|uniref:hypothetical protein n=1 Tax=Shewanella sp. 10N.286.51.B8 TaxID=3229708 RepID=UPI0035518099
MPKTKKLPLNSLEWHQHPKLTTLLSGDCHQLSTLPDLQFISFAQLQSILDSCPIPVVKRAKVDAYYLLAPMPILKQLLGHPDSHKLTASLNIYSEPEPTLSTLALIKPALFYQKYKRLPEILHSRLDKAKSMNLVTPNKNQISQLAQISPSAFRKITHSQGGNHG